MDNRGKQLLIYEDPATHGRVQTAVAFADGHVEMVPVGPAFQQLINDAEKASKRSAEPDEQDKP